MVHVIGDYLPSVWCWCEWLKEHDPAVAHVGFTQITHVGNGTGEGAISVSIDPITKRGVCPSCGDVYVTEKASNG